MPHTMAPGDDRDVTRTYRAPGEPGAADSSSAAPTWGQFRLLGELGRGGFGRVYHAWDPTLARDIALKIVHLPDTSRAAAALHEGRLLARVRHRNVVTVYGAQQIGDEVGLWMELVRGRHLSQIVREHGPMGAEEATLVGISVCQALAAVHGANLIHRDVKANNVMRESGGRIVLMDFGAGLDSDSPGASDLTGTPIYMAPELLLGQPASPASDLYSVGVLLFHVVTGDYPIEGRSVVDLAVAHRHGQRHLLADRRPDLPDGFVRVVERALSASPADRPPSAGAMLRELTTALPVGPAGNPDAMPTESGETPATFTPSGAVTRPPLSPMRIVTGVLAGVTGIGVLGFMSTVAFNESLQRDSSFSSDRIPVDWFLYGARSLFGPALLAAVVLLAGRLVVTACRLIARMVPPLGRIMGALARSFARVSRQAGGTDVVAVSQWLVAGQVAALVFVWLRFAALIEAIAVPSETDAAKLLLLADSSDEPFLYRGTLTLLCLGMAMGWQTLLSRPQALAVVHRSTVVAGLAAIVFALLMLVVPYRLLYHNEAPRLVHEGARCYEVGSRSDRLLLYCPDLAPPRVRLADRATTQPDGVRESIFSATFPTQ